MRQLDEGVPAWIFGRQILAKSITDLSRRNSCGTKALFVGNIVWEAAFVRRGRLSTGFIFTSWQVGNIGHWSGDRFFLIRLVKRIMGRGRHWMIGFLQQQAVLSRKK